MEQGWSPSTIETNFKRRGSIKVPTKTGKEVQGRVYVEETLRQRPVEKKRKEDVNSKVSWIVSNFNKDTNEQIVPRRGDPTFGVLSP